MCFQGRYGTPCVSGYHTGQCLSPEGYAWEQGFLCSAYIICNMYLTGPLWNSLCVRLSYRTMFIAGGICLGTGFFVQCLYYMQYVFNRSIMELPVCPVIIQDNVCRRRDMPGNRICVQCVCFQTRVHHNNTELDRR